MACFSSFLQLICYLVHCTKFCCPCFPIYLCVHFQDGFCNFWFYGHWKGCSLFSVVGWWTSPTFFILIGSKGFQVWVAKSSGWDSYFKSFRISDEPLREYATLSLLAGARLNGRSTEDLPTTLFTMFEPANYLVGIIFVSCLNHQDLFSSVSPSSSFRLGICVSDIISSFVGWWWWWWFRRGSAWRTRYGGDLVQLFI